MSRLRETIQPFSIACAPMSERSITRRTFMNYVFAAPLAATALSLASPSAASIPVPTVAWVKAMQMEGWVFSLKARSWRDGKVVASDPRHIDDYSIRRAGAGTTDDTDLFLAALERAGGAALPASPDPFLEVVERVETIRLDFEDEELHLSDEEVNDIVEETDRLLITTPPRSVPGAIAAVQLARREFLECHSDDSDGTKVMLALFDGIEGVLERS